VWFSQELVFGASVNRFVLQHSIAVRADPVPRQPDGVLAPPAGCISLVLRELLARSVKYVVRFHGDIQVLSTVMAATKSITGDISLLMCSLLVGSCFQW
jgi:hypothetical protein